MAFNLQSFDANLVTSSIQIAFARRPFASTLPPKPYFLFILPRPKRLFTCSPSSRFSLCLAPACPPTLLQLLSIFFISLSSSLKKQQWSTSPSLPCPPSWAGLGRAESAVLMEGCLGRSSREGPYIVVLGIMWQLQVSSLHFF